MSGKLHLITGYARSGKGIFSSYLKDEEGFDKVYAYADNIRLYLEKVNPMVSSNLYLEDLLNYYPLSSWHKKWELAKSSGHKDEVRRLLQNAGEACRSIWGDTFWIDSLERDIDFSQKSVISDTRFLKEVTVAKKEWLFDNDELDEVYVGRVLGSNDDEHVPVWREHISEQEHLFIREDYQIFIDLSRGYDKKYINGQIRSQVKNLSHIFET